MVGGKRRGVSKDHGRVNFALGDQFDNFTVFFLSARGDNRACSGFRLEHRRDVGFLALDDKVVDDQVSKYVAVKAMSFSGIERPLKQTAGRVDSVEAGKRCIGGDDNRERGVELWRLEKNGSSE